MSAKRGPGTKTSERSSSVFPGSEEVVEEETDGDGDGEEEEEDEDDDESGEIDSFSSKREDWKKYCRSMSNPSTSRGNDLAFKRKK